MVPNHKKANYMLDNTCVAASSKKVFAGVQCTVLISYFLLTRVDSLLKFRDMSQAEAHISQLLGTAYSPSPPFARVPCPRMLV